MARALKEKPAVAVDPDFLSASELARCLGLKSTETLGRWVSEGSFPPPWAFLGPRKRVWKMDHYREFVKTGKWPDEAWKD